MPYYIIISFRYAIIDIIIDIDYWLFISRCHYFHAIDLLLMPLLPLFRHYITPLRHCRHDITPPLRHYAIDIIIDYYWLRHIDIDIIDAISWLPLMPLFRHWLIAYYFDAIITLLIRWLRHFAIVLFHIDSLFRFRYFLFRCHYAIIDYYWYCHYWLFIIAIIDWLLLIHYWYFIDIFHYCYAIITPWYYCHYFDIIIIVIIFSFHWLLHWYIIIDIIDTLRHYLLIIISILISLLPAIIDYAITLSLLIFHAYYWYIDFAIELSPLFYYYWYW
jgi:hypothetical protein